MATAKKTQRRMIKAIPDSGAKRLQTANLALRSYNQRLEPTPYWLFYQPIWGVTIVWRSSAFQQMQVTRSPRVAYALQRQSGRSFPQDSRLQHAELPRDRQGVEILSAASADRPQASQNSPAMLVAPRGVSLTRPGDDILCRIEIFQVRSFFLPTCRTAE